MKALPRYLFRFLTLGADKGENITRYSMYNQLAGLAQGKPGLKVLSISGSQKLCTVLGFPEESITDASYPEYNVLDLPFEDGEFDAVISDQVLEHVEGNPQHAIDETLRVLKPGGVLVHATCFINPIHGAPSDFWRFTPDGLSLLVKDRAEVIECGGWGNAFIWLFFALGLRYERIPHAKWHPFNWLARFNQYRLPVTTWVVARKSTSVA